MLILNRKKDESIQIGDDIEIKVVAVEGDQIKIGIEAPRSVDVYRKEIYIKIQEENQEASNASDDLINLLKSFKKE
ncbi:MULTISPECIES: carbon storage regulator CsrA [Pontibacillus]|uniref:Translational regulator CsrA n=1 Tax=Pontibacillus chungwhensis TaxID=265426 RepID=A0ABY8UYK9_9BACI|nr:MULTISPECIES: carbon storage regulator CsrA [Pontibacillus]MCD5325908.1 carbon storage regulator CsrA [Pontibacillus sp. HN14]WIF97619.1 carbon storage regulator CsrA [Pontibacillus chungwhensis]